MAKEIYDYRLNSSKADPYVIEVEYTVRDSVSTDMKKSGLISITIANTRTLSQAIGDIEQAIKDEEGIE